MLREYRRKGKTTVTAVQVDLDTDGFTYRKWGGTQRCKRGDWLLNNQGDTYTVDGETFARTYREVSAGVYRKEASVWAEQAETAGTIQTKEGSTDYEAGDFLVFNDPEGKDGYAVTAKKFHALYELM
jgi:hypothetical protein